MDCSTIHEINSIRYRVSTKDGVTTMYYTTILYYYFFTTSNGNKINSAFRHAVHRLINFVSTEKRKLIQHIDILERRTE